MSLFYRTTQAVPRRDLLEAVGFVSLESRVTLPAVRTLVIPYNPPVQTKEQHMNILFWMTTLAVNSRRPTA